MSKCSIFRCTKKQEMYLYLPYADDKQVLTSDLDAGLLKLTGALEHVMDLDLSTKKELARVDINEVINALKEKGFYLQMPPNDILRKDDSMLNDSSDSF